MKKLLLSPWLALITLFILVGVRVKDPTFVQSIRLRYFDTLITSVKPTENHNVYVVNIDDRSLDKYGQWPFPRQTYADIIKDLYAHHAGLVVWNVLMPEPDRFGGDRVLARTLKQYPVVLGDYPSNYNKNTPHPPGSAVIGSDNMDMLVTYPGLVANVPDLEMRAAGTGLVNTLPEIDGVNRRIPLVAMAGGRLYAGLPLETLRVATGNSTFQVKMDANGVEKMRLPGDIGIIDTDSFGRIWIDWSQKNPSYSLINLPASFDNGIVIVGTSAAGIANPVPTSIGAVFPQQVQASVVDTLINKVNIQRPAWSDSAEIIALTVAGLVLLFISRWTYVGIIISLVVIGGSILLEPHVYQDRRWLLDVSYPAGSLVLVLLHAYFTKFLSEYLQKQQIKRQFGTYLSPAMVEKLQKNPELLQLGGESRELSIMFTDVRGFTSISEHYGKDVQGLTKIMNRYMTAMTAKIIDNNGTLDKYIGDAQMAFWNAPLDDADHAKHAVKTALEMLGDLDAFNQEIARDGVPAFGMGLGINTDTVVVGNMGSSQRFDYTCLGDGVNLASRLEGQSKPYGVAMVIGSKTAEQVQDEYQILELDCIAVKGKTQGVRIYTVLDHKDKNLATEADLQMHAAMLELYRQQKFDQAIEFCHDLTGRFEGKMDRYYASWIERCREMKNAELPKEWDFVYRATSK